LKKLLYLLLVLLLTPLLFYGQKRTVSELGVERIEYGDIAEYVYDGNPFNDNEKSLYIAFRNPKNSHKSHIWKGFKFSKSDISEEKVDFLGNFFQYTILYYIMDTNYKGEDVEFPEWYVANEPGFYEFIFDNDKSSYFKLDENSIYDIKSLDNELFMKFKNHKKAIIRWNHKVAKNRIAKGPEFVEEIWGHSDYVIDLKGFTAAYNKYMEIKSPTAKNKNLYKVSNGLANVNPFNLDKYIDKFIMDAKTNHNIDLSYVNKKDRLILFKELQGETIAAAYKMNDDNSVLVLVDPENWYDANQAKRWYIIYHELRHDILNLEHGECGPMMNESARGSYTWSRLEKDKNTMFNTYKRKK
jgi:hypothetical protein